jgi:hypothetical protein
VLAVAGACGDAGTCRAEESLAIAAMARVTGVDAGLRGGVAAFAGATEVEATAALGVAAARLAGTAGVDAGVGLRVARLAGEGAAGKAGAEQTRVAGAALTVLRAWPLLGGREPVAESGEAAQGREESFDHGAT